MYKLAEPPILESQVGLIFKSKIELHTVESSLKKLEASFPKNNKRYNFTQTISIDGKEPERGAAREHVGFQFLSDDSKSSLFINKDSIFFTELNKYNSWDELLKNTLSAFHLLGNELSDTNVVAITSRYINLIKIQPPFNPFDYFKFFPNVTSINHNLTMNSLNMNFRVNSNKGHFADVSFYQRGIEQETGKIEFILDIVSYLNIEMKISEMRLKDNELASLRDFKNDLFFNLISQEAIENNR